VLGFAGIEALELALFEPAGIAGLRFDPPCDVAFATGMHGIPFGFGTAPVWPLAGIEEFGCVPVCVAGPAVVCTSLPAAFVVMGVGGPIVVICGAAGVPGGTVAVGGAALGVDAPEPAFGGVAGVALLCAKPQQLHIKEIAMRKIRFDTETSRQMQNFRDESFP